MLNTKGFNSKTKQGAVYADIPSARRPVDHCPEVPIPAFSGLPSLGSEGSSIKAVLEKFKEQTA